MERRRFAYIAKPGSESNPRQTEARSQVRLWRVRSTRSTLLFGDVRIRLDSSLRSTVI